LALGLNTFFSVVDTLMHLILKHHGNSIGIAEVRYGGEVWIGDFAPAAGYASVESIVVTANEALRNLGFLGPVADPQSEIAGRAALEALEVLCAELTVATENGLPIGARVVRLIDSGQGGRRSVFLRPDDPTADVPAVLPPRHRTDAGFDAPEA
jgi:hypothetical protein